MFREVNAQDTAGWENRVDDFLDLRQFVTQAAIETFLSELDGLIGGWGMNNFYLYRPGGSRQHRLFPWDKDNTFQASDSSILLRAEENHILSRALARDDLRAVSAGARRLRARPGARRLAGAGRSRSRATS